MNPTTLKISTKNGSIQQKSTTSFYSLFCCLLLYCMWHHLFTQTIFKGRNDAMSLKERDFRIAVIVFYCGAEISLIFLLSFFHLFEMLTVIVMSFAFAGAREKSIYWDDDGWKFVKIPPFLLSFYDGKSPLESRQWQRRPFPFLIFNLE